MHNLSDEIIGKIIVGYCENPDGFIEIFLNDGEDIYVDKD